MKATQVLRKNLGVYHVESECMLQRFHSYPIDRESVWSKEFGRAVMYCLSLFGRVLGDASAGPELHSSTRGNGQLVAWG